MSDTYYQTENPQYDDNFKNNDVENQHRIIPIENPFRHGEVHYVPIITSNRESYSKAVYIYVIIIWCWLMSMGGLGLDYAEYTKHFMYTLIEIGYIAFDVCGLIWCLTYAIFYFRTYQMKPISSIRTITFKYFLFIFCITQLLAIYSTIIVILMFIFTKYDIGDIFYLIIYVSFMIVYMIFMCKFFKDTD